MAALEMRLDRPQEPGPRPRASLGSGPTAPTARSPGSRACPAWSLCCPCSRTSQTSTRSWCSKWSSSPRTGPSTGVWPPLAFPEENAPGNYNPPATCNKVTQQTSTSLGLTQPQAWSLAVPSQGSCRPLGSSGLTPASAGPCPWRTRSPSSRGPL